MFATARELFINWTIRNYVRMYKEGQKDWQEIQGRKTVIIFALLCILKEIRFFPYFHCKKPNTVVPLKQSADNETNRL